MDNLKKEFPKDICHEMYKVVAEYELWIGHQDVRIKILVNDNGQYSHKVSHYYQGSEQAGPYITSINTADTIGGAIYNAKRELLSFYKKDDKNARWIENECY